MKNLLTPRKTAAAASLLCVGMAAAAVQSFGPVSGAPQVGRPLELTVPARFAAGDDEACAAADVYYGDNKVDDALVSTQVREGARGRWIAVTTRAPVNEAFVTVELRAGCRSQFTRRFTLLSEAKAGDEDRPVVAAAAAWTAPVAAAPASTRIAGAAPATVVERAARAVRGLVDGPRAPRSERLAVAKVQREPEGRDRLKMDAWRAPSAESVAQAATHMDGGPLLRVSTRLGALPGDDAARRAAAALMWKALNSDPQEMQRTLHAMRGLESEVAVLKTSATQSRMEAAGLRQQVDRLQKPSLPAWLLPLAGVLALSLAAAGWAWQHARRTGLNVGKWYAPLSGSSLPERVEPQEPARQEPQPAQPPVEVAAKPKQPPAQAAVEKVPFDLPDDDWIPSRIETLTAVIHEVGFLHSLGMAGDAIDALKNYLQSEAQRPQIAYCELMRLCAQSEDQAALATVRSHWWHAFGTHAPPLWEIEAASGLEVHPAVLSRISDAWPGSAAMEQIEELLFAPPQPGQPMSLQAWRDLLWLYEMAKAMADGAVAQQDALPEKSERAPWLPDDPSIIRQPWAVDLDLGAKTEPGAVKVNHDDDATRPRKPPAAQLPKVDWVVTKVKEKAKENATYEDLFDAISASEGKYAHRR